MCNSIASNGSDFFISGPTPIIVVTAGGTCDAAGLSSTVTIILSAPIVQAGTYTLHLRVGSDGNTLVDECGEEVPAGETINFNTADTVSAAFSITVSHGCLQDTLAFSNNVNNGINAWQWLFNDGYSNTTQSFTRIYKDSGQMTATLTVGNGVCSNSSTQNFTLAGKIKAAFAGPVTLCPNDTAVFKDASTGYITAWSWYFGYGQTSTAENPPYQLYAANSRETDVPVRLIVQNDVPCYDTVYHDMQILYSCYIAVASAFTPNGDGRNDYLYPLNAYKAVNLEFRVFNRWGQQVFETKDWTRKWDGTVNGAPQASGVYVWMLSYTDSDTGKQYQQKGTTVLIR
jgi:gliding motility-associated-like protein